MKQILSFVLLLLILNGCQINKPLPHSIPKDPLNTIPGQVSMNGIGFQDENEDEYKILVIGHVYGTIEGSDKDPAQTLVNKIPDIVSQNIRMMVSLGDMVKASSREDFESLDQILLSKLPFPVFNTPGNHDVENRKLYEELFGQTFFSFKHGPVRLIFLDTEREMCKIDAEQLDLIRESFKDAIKDNETEFVLIFMHRTYFFNNADLFEMQNYSVMPNSWDCYGQPFFEEVMNTILVPFAEVKPIYLFSGDVGAWGNLTPYYEILAENKITLVMTGLGDTTADSGILVTVKEKEILIENFPLVNEILPPLETYSPDYWIKKAKGE